jgi:hypothetical protein
VFESPNLSAGHAETHSILVMVPDIIVFLNIPGMHEVHVDAVVLQVAHGDKQGLHELLTASRYCPNGHAILK